MSGHPCWTDTSLRRGEARDSSVRTPPDTCRRVPFALFRSSLLAKTPKPQTPRTPEESGSGTFPTIRGKAHLVPPVEVSATGAEMRPGVLRVLVMGGVWALCSASSARAQSVVQSLGNHLRDAAGDGWGVWTVPLRGTQKDWLIALGVVAGSAALSPLDDNVDRWVMRNQESAVWDPLSEVR